MRIKNRNTAPVLGILGKVKVGDKATNQNGKEYPVSLDYFRFKSNEAMRVKRMDEMFGEKPTKIPVTFHCDDPDQVCIQRYEIRDSAGKLVAYGDGVNFWESHKEGFLQKPELTVQQGEKYMAELAKQTKTEWSETLTLRFMVLQYPELGLWEFTTKGKDTSIGQIIAAFDTVLESAGRVKGIPFWLTVEKHKSNRANANRQYPVVNLVCDLSPEMVETVAALGDGVRGLITPAKLQAGHSGQPLSISAGSGTKEDIDFEEADVIEEDEPGQIVAQPAETPDLDGIEPIEATVDNRELIGSESEKWASTVDYIITKGGKLAKVEEKYRFSQKDREHLLNLEWYRQELLNENMSLKMILSNDVRGGEKMLFEALAKAKNLK